MKIQSVLLGELEVEEKELVTFPEGIPGFEDELRFAVIGMGENSPFYYLQSINNPALCFILGQPFVFFPNYSIEIGEAEVRKLECGDRREDLAIYVIITVAEDFRQSTANLLAPIIINAQKKKGLQFMASNSDYNTRHYIFPQNQGEMIAAAREG